MSEYAKLVISVDSTQAKKAEKDLGALDKSASNLTSGLGKLIGPLVSVATAMAALNKAADVQRQFDVLNSGLITATGSSEKAAVAFKALQTFAQKTPYDLNQAVKGFTQLVNLGLTPSEKALMSYGNTASAMSKDLSQMIEAVADASTGEFERLKEFGIKAKVNGDQVALTFQGVTTKIGNNAKDIEGYLIKLGETKFGNAMTLRMATLDGAVSNLGDTWENTFRLINSAGLGDIMRSSVNDAANALTELNNQIASGELETNLSAVAGKFSGFGKDIEFTLSEISKLFEDNTGYWGRTLDANVANMTATFRDFPENVRAFIQVMTVEVLAGFDQVKAYARAFNDGINAIFTGDTFEGVGARLEAELNVAQSAREGTLQSIFDEREASLSSFAAQTEAAKEKRKVFDDNAKADAANTTDRLAQFRVLGEGTKSQTEADKKSAKESEQLAKQRKKALDDLISQSSIAVSSSNAMADAYLAGADNVRELTIQQKIEEELLKTGAAARDKVTDAVNKEADAKDRLDIAQSIANMRTETTQTLAQAAATLQGKSALEAFNIQKSMTVALAGKSIEYGSQEYDLLLQQTKAQLEANKALEQANAVEGIVDRLSPQTKLLRDFTAEQDALNAAIARGTDKTPMYQEALKKLGLEYEQNKAAASEWGQFTQGAVDRIDDAFADMWQSVLTKSGNFMDTLKNSFKQFLAEMLHMAITKPIIVQIGSALGVGGLSASNSGGGILSSITGGDGGVMSYISTAKNVMSVAGSKFAESVMAGWAGGDGIIGGITGAFEGGASYAGSAITSAFTTGSSSAATSMAAGASQAGYANLGQAGASSAAMDGVTQSAGQLSSTLGGLSAALSYIQGAYSIYTAFQDYGVAGGLTTAGFAAAGAAIGSFVGPLGTAIGFALGATLGAMGAGKWFGGPNYEQLVSSSEGTYSNGQYTDGGWVDGWKENKTRLGTGTDMQLSSYVQQFTSTLGMLYEALGDGSDVSALATMRRRETSGDYSNYFQATLDSGEMINGLQQYGLSVADNLTTYYDDFMGTFLAQAIVKSTSLPDYFKAQFQEFSTDWDTTADEVIAAIEGVFTRFNGVNDALGQINVANLKLDETGMIASDSILNMVAALAELDTESATAKDKVKALQELVNGYYTVFFSADEQFADLTKSLEGSFAGFGLDLPDTRSAYRDMVEDIDVTTAAGQAMFATMMGLATAADSYYTEIDRQAQAAADAAKEAAQAAADAAKEAAQAAADAWSNFYNLFAVDAQKTNDTLATVTGQFKALGLTLPESRDAFAEMVLTIDRTTEKGRALFDSLLGLATNADAAFSIIEARTKAANDALNLGVTNSFSAVQRAITAQQKAAQDAYNATTASLNDMAETASSNISDLTSVGSDLSSALKALRGDSADAVQMLQAQARATLQSALATARSGGSLSGFAGFEDALDTVGSNNTDLYGSMEDFARDQGRTANVIAELEGINGKQLTSAEATLKTLQDQLDQAEDAYDAQMDQFDRQLEFAQAQMDALNGVDNSVMGVTAAVNAMNSAIVAALQSKAAADSVANTPQNNATLIDTLYQAVLGRDASDTSDAAGKAGWAAQLQNGSLSYADAAKAIANAAIGFDSTGYAGGVSQGTIDSSKAAAQAYLDSLKVPGFASGGDFGGGLRLVGENGPELEVTGPSRIFNAKQTAAMLNGGGDNGALLSEVRLMREENKSQRFQIAKTNQQMATLLQKWDAEGAPKERDYAL